MGAHLPPKRHNSYPRAQPTPLQTPPLQPPPPPPTHLIPAPGETLFRILCPVSRIGAVIGKGGSVIHHLREETGARIRILDDFLSPYCEDRVIHIIASDSTAPPSNANSTDLAASSDNSSGVENVDNSKVDESYTAAQKALMLVFEKIVKADEDRSEKADDEEEQRKERKERKEESGEENANAQGSNYAICKLLAPSNQVGCVLGKGGKIVEKIRRESGSQIRIFVREHIPPCAWPGDELILITGNFQSVRKGLLSVSGCLQDNIRPDALLEANISNSIPQRGRSSGHAVDYQPRSYTSWPAPEHFGPKAQMIPEEKIVFKILCQIDKVGSLIGKGGCIIRSIEDETGASIKIADAVTPDSDERVVIISAQENMEMQRSPAQDALVRVYNRISEVGSEPGATAVVRLLVHSQQIGFLLGKGGNIIAEMRRLTGASIQIFGREQGLKFGTPNEDILQVIGSLHSVHVALFHITCSLRERIFPWRPYLYDVSSSACLPPFPERPSPPFRPMHDSLSPGHYPSPIGLPHGFNSFSAGRGHSHQFSNHGIDRISAANSDRFHHHYGNDGPNSPMTWNPQVISGSHPSRTSDVRPDRIARDGQLESGCSQPLKTTIEVLVPESLLSHISGENSSDLSQITQMSGANVIVHDPKPGCSWGLVVITGAPNQLYIAQSLVQAFILCGQTF